MTGSWETKVTCLLVLTIATSESKICETKPKSIFDSDDNGFINCPENGDPSYFTNCCGPSWDRKCCAENSLMNWNDNEDNKHRLDFDLDIEEGAKKLAIDNILHIRPKRKAQTRTSDYEALPQPLELKGKSIFKFVGIVIGLVALLIVVSIICCCCLPCCFLAKRRTRGGVVHGPGATNDPGYPSQQAVPLNQPGPYPTQGGAYPPHSAQPPQSAYPPQNQNMYPSQGAYPPQGAPPNYSDNPPPYPGPPAHGYQDYQTKQPAFNPNM